MISIHCSLRLFLIFSLQIFSAMHCIGFSQLAFSLHVQTNGGFIGLLCLGELLGYLIFKHYYDSLASSPASLPLLHEPEFLCYREESKNSCHNYMSFL